MALGGVIDEIAQARLRASGQRGPGAGWGRGRRTIRMLVMRPGEESEGVFYDGVEVCRARAGGGELCEGSDWSTSERMDSTEER